MTATSPRRFVLLLGLLLPIAGCSTPAPTTPAKLGDAEAVATYRQAADHGSAPAQLYLGLAYDLGQGVEMDKAEAERWWRTAAAQGNEAAARNLMQLRSQSWATPACADAGIPLAWRCRQLPARLTPLP
jgi:TPR repeat protein